MPEHMAGEGNWWGEDELQGRERKGKIRVRSSIWGDLGVGFTVLHISRLNVLW